MPALGNKLPTREIMAVRFLVAGRFAGTDGCNCLGGNFQEGFGHRAVSSDAIAAFIFQARGEQGESALLRE